jgi:type IV pilus assembly protein PilC
MFGSQIPLKSLAQLCQSLGTMLTSGLALPKAIELSVRKAKHPRVRKAMGGVLDEILTGQDVATAFRKQAGAFPELMIDMIAVAERAGHLPEVLKSLAEHYENSLRLRRTFIAAIAWPVIQLGLAILIIGFLILILGAIADSKGGQAFDVLGLGLTGAAGAATWFAWSIGTVGGLLGLVWFLHHGFQTQRVFDALLMKVPVVGKCLQSFAIARFSWAYALTQQSGMSVAPSLDASLKATGNGAYIAAAAPIRQRVLDGDELSEALDLADLFPEEFLHVVHVGETSGTVPETLERLSPQFEEQARRGLRTMTMALAGVVWLTMAGFIIFFIFRIVFWYVGMLNDAARGF